MQKIELVETQQLESKQEYSPVPVKIWFSASEWINVSTDEYV